MASKQKTLKNDPTQGTVDVGSRTEMEDLAILSLAILTIVGMMLTGQEFDRKGAAVDTDLLASSLRRRFPHLFPDPVEKE